MKHVIFAAVAVGFVLAGCSDGPVADNSALKGPASGSMVIANPDDYKPSDDPEVRADRFREAAEFRAGLRLALLQAEGWRDADARAREMLADAGGVPAFKAEQFAAYYMLTMHLLPGSYEAAPEKREAVGYYTDLLVRHRNPNASLIASALSRLEGTWDDERRARAAEASYGAAERLVQVKTGCDECSLAEARLTQVAGDDHVARSVRDAVEGAERLQEMF